MITQNELNAQITQNRADIERLNALDRLNSNPDFVLLFKSYYCNAQVIELTKQLALLDSDNLSYKNCIHKLNAISYFMQFMENIQTKGAMAIASLDEVMAIPSDEVSDE